MDTLRQEANLLHVKVSLSQVQAAEAVTEFWGQSWQDWDTCAEVCGAVVCKTYLSWPEWDIQSQIVENLIIFQQGLNS